MKIEIDAKPSTNERKASFVVRLLPEVNQDMCEMEWAMSINYVPREIIRVSNSDNRFHYAIVFEKEQR